MYIHISYKPHSLDSQKTQRQSMKQNTVVKAFRRVKTFCGPWHSTLFYPYSFFD